ncbi:hypothetical protein I7I48_04038 [Histoplasma ohiense]|nr:hypothetical protein I7I48_04038 [Histoplasma ohiense (nom. inval.)]
MSTMILAHSTPFYCCLVTSKYRYIRYSCYNTAKSSIIINTLSYFPSSALHLISIKLHTRYILTYII